MAQRSIPISVRVSDDDAAFLAEFEAPGAKTPSDKLRAILAMARQQHESGRDFVGCVELLETMLRPAIHRLREAQRTADIRSDFVFRLYERMPELMADLVTSAPPAGADADTLRRFEARLADQLFSMIEQVLELALTTRSRTYDQKLIDDRIQPVLEVVDLVKLSHKQRSGEAA